MGNHMQNYGYYLLGDIVLSGTGYCRFLEESGLYIHTVSHGDKQGEITMRKTVFLGAIFMTMFGFWGAATQANATHPRFCDRRPTHPHCVIIGNFTASFVSLVNPVGEVDGSSGGINSIGEWFVKTPGLNPNTSYEICFRASKITGSGSQ